MNATTDGFNILEPIEFFHLAFLSVLERRLDQRAYILKGGANLRYFFGSPRFSEDIDFDAKDIPRAKLEEVVDRVLDSKPLAFILRTRRMTATQASKPKQTETTQRWKIGLLDGAGKVVARTRLEFSRRGLDDRHQLDQIPEAVAAPYALHPPTVSRYLPEAMIELKIRALGQRAETQARDVFDLDLLFRQYGAIARSGAFAITADTLARAADHALGLSFDAYRTQVVAFLSPEAVEVYESESAWHRMQEHVVAVITAMQ